MRIKARQLEAGDVLHRVGNGPTSSYVPALLVGKVTREIFAGFGADCIRVSGRPLVRSSYGDLFLWPEADCQVTRGGAA